MPIEIKEVIIKTRVEKEPPGANVDETQMLQIEEMKNEILKSCRQMIEKMQRRQTKR